jgi:putative isomerase
MGYQSITMDMAPAWTTQPTCYPESLCKPPIQIVFWSLQMDTLAEIAGKPRKDADKQKWQSRSNELLKQMLTMLWKGVHFIRIRSLDGVQTDSQSLLLYLPIILGKRLPSDVRNKLVQRLTEEGRFLTPHGFATEALTSKFYTPNGHWRGPIWAPSTMLLAEGLDSAGEYSLARKCAKTSAEWLSRAAWVRISMQSEAKVYAILHIHGHRVST